MLSKTPQKLKSHAKFLTSLLRWVILIGLSAPLGYALYKQWIGVQTTLLTIDWVNFAVGSLLQLAGLPLMGLISWIVLRYLNSQMPLLRAVGIYFLSQLAKYLPGGIWAFPGRAVAYQAAGVDRVASVLSVMREVIGLFLGAAVMGLLGLMQGLPVSKWINLTTLAGILICIVLVVLTQLPDFWKIIKRIKFLNKINLSVFEAKQSQRDLRWLGYTFLVSLVYWLITGIGFYYIAVAVTPRAATLTWLQASSIFSLAWCVGFVVVVAPAGIGVRESALSLLLSQTMPVSEALTVAIVARLWWTMTEAIYIIIALVWLSGKTNRFLLTKVRSARQGQAAQEIDRPA
jgi:uncharacterized membrane protein YbhN (UPF0104 family)